MSLSGGRSLTGGVPGVGGGRRGSHWGWERVGGRGVSWECI